MASETTAAATGAVGKIRRDPMAMKPFCGYNYGDYWAHWLSFSDKASNLPRIFHVNWFRKDRDGRFMWPGFGENMRVIDWILRRCTGAVGARETAVGNLPFPQDIDLEGIETSPETLETLLAVETQAWAAELEDIGRYLEEYGERTPSALREERRSVSEALSA
jgi:phosphoenolpyruvate carboxykinase (GTP)